MPTIPTTIDLTTWFILFAMALCGVFLFSAGARAEDRLVRGFGVAVVAAAAASGCLLR